jgi:hypothetical protein
MVRQSNYYFRIEPQKSNVDVINYIHQQWTVIPLFLGQFTFYPKGLDKPIFVNNIHQAADECYKRFNGSLPLLKATSDLKLFSESLSSWLKNDVRASTVTNYIFLANNRWWAIWHINAILEKCMHSQLIIHCMVNDWFVEVWRDITVCRLFYLCQQPGPLTVYLFVLWLLHILTCFLGIS